MSLLATLVGLLLVAVALSDAFETIVMPRRVSGVTVSKIFYRLTWMPVAALGRRMPPGDRRETFLSIYGPVSLLLLIVLWGMILIVGFALLLWAAGSDPSLTRFGNLYVSGVTFTTLGLGDFPPKTDLARFITVVEAGTGLGFLAVVIAYLPILYQSFSRREIAISMLDAWGGSPPSGGELLRRTLRADAHEELRPLLARWEEWTAELLESHLSYQVLSYFRSQHENQSWLAALIAVMDLSTIWQAGHAEGKTSQARRLYAIGRHALRDLSQVVRATPKFAAPDRLSEAELNEIHDALVEAGTDVHLPPLRGRP